MSAPSPEHVDAVARALHAEHVREFAWMGGTHLSDPVLVEDCGNCQRWARYASTLLTDAAMLDALTRHGVLTEEAELRARLAAVEAERDTLTHLLGSHADGHLCTCTMTDPGVYHGDNMHPPEWEQDPWCPTHPHMPYVVEVHRKVVARLAAVESLPDEWEGEADANETHPKESRTLLSAAAELRAAIAAWDE